MAYKISLFLMFSLLVGCETSKRIEPVESGKVVMVKRWDKNEDQSIFEAKKGDLKTVSVKERSPWDRYERSIGKDLEHPPKIGREFLFPDNENR